MDTPNSFCFLETLRHRSPEFVRQVVEHAGFDRRTPGGTANSEIWVKACESGGFWAVRLDTMGHRRGHFGSRPHYHKNWIASEPALQKYLAGPSNQDVWLYSDAGLPLGPAGKSNPAHPDKLAKLQHISR